MIRTTVICLALDSEGLEGLVQGSNKGSLILLEGLCQNKLQLLSLSFLINVSTKSQQTLIYVLNYHIF